MSRLPDFFLVGSSKAGTTAICSALAKHTEICFSEEKEPNFFSGFDESLENIPSEKILEYLNLFKYCNSTKVMGEGSVKYLDSDKALYWIHRYVPSAKIIIVLRNPINRIVSLYEMYERLRMMPMNPEEAFESDSYLVKQCILYERVSRYIKAFGKNQVFVMIFEDFVRNPNLEFCRLCQFLNIRETTNTEISLRNRGGVPKMKALRFLTNRVMVRHAKRILPKSKQSTIDNFIKKLLFKKHLLSSSQKEKLEHLFYDDVSNLGELIDRDLCKIWQLGNGEIYSG